MPSAMIPPKFRAFDGEGKPLAFGRVYTYQAGTNVPKLTFRSEDGAVPNTNPVILNADGYADIFLKGSYKIVVKDVDEVEIWTADPVSSAENQGSQWINHHTAEKYGSNQIKIFENVTDIFHVGRRIQLEAGIVLYGEVTATTFNGEFTIVTLSLDDSDSVPATVSGAYVGILSALNTSLPKNKFIDSIQGDEAAAALSFEAGTSIKSKIQSVEQSASSALSKANQTAASLEDYKVSNASDVAGLQQSIDDNREAIEANTIGFVTKADMDADLAHEEGTLAKVVRDGDINNNGTYIKTGASGEGSWLPSTFDRVQSLENDLESLESDVGLNSAYVGTKLDEIFTSQNAQLLHSSQGNFIAFLSVFSGWRVPVTYTDEEFDIIRFYFPIEEPGVVKVTVEDELHNIVASASRYIVESGWHYFKLDKLVNSSLIQNGVMHIGYSAGAIRMSRSSGAFPANHPDFETYGVSYTKTNTGYDDWFDVSSGDASYCTTFQLFKSTEALVVDPTATIEQDLYSVIASTEVAEYDSKDAVFLASGTINTLVRVAPFTGWASKFNRIAGAEFNLVRLVRVRRGAVSQDEKWATIVLNVYQGDVGGAIVATSTVAVDPESADISNIEFVLSDPVTGDVITLTDAILDPTYALGYYALNSDGQPAVIGETTADVSNFAGESYYTTNDGSSWSNYSNDPCVAFESFLAVNPEKVKQYSIKSGVVIPFDEQQQAIEIIASNDMYGVDGFESSLYFDNLVYQRFNDYLWDVVCSRGHHQDERFVVDNDAPGVYNLTVTAHNPESHAQVGEKAMTLRIADPVAGAGKNPKCLFIGDSTTAGGIYTGELVNLFSADGSMDATLIGTISGSGTGNNHEGRGGWKVETYYTDENSPFVFNGNFSFTQYMSGNGFSGVDWVFFHLGINDVFGQSSDSGVDSITEVAMQRLQLMIDSIRGYDASIKIGMMVTIPPSAQQDAFGANYSANQTQWRYKRNIMLWAKALIDAFEGKQAEDIYMVPVNLNLDTEHNMAQSVVPANSRTNKTVVRQANGLHPSSEGYYQMADAIYYFLKYQEQ